MPEDPVKSIEEALQSMESLAGTSSRKPSTSRNRSDPERQRRGFLRRWVTRLVLLLLATALPFFVLVRLSVFLYLKYGVNHWFALGGGVLATTALLLIYTFLIRKRIRIRGGTPAWFARGLLVLVVVYCGYALVYVSGSNVKSDDLRSTYRSLHPIMRVAVSTLVIADREMVITDTERTPADYDRMGLPQRERSLHYRQENGYVHAVDLRTLGRPEWKNSLVVVYFRIMGFHTLRHVGTADHLHVSLPA
jgi:hypothetical protein